MTEAVHDYHSGDQDTTEQLSTFRTFGKMIKWGSLAVAVLLLMLVLWFCVGAGFFTGLLTGIIVTAVGVFFLREKAPAGH
jgi:thiamine transporter ThiT